MFYLKTAGLLGMSDTDASIKIFLLQEPESHYVRPTSFSEIEWTEDQQLSFIEDVLRGSGHLPKIVFQKIPNTNPQAYEVLEGCQSIETLRKFLSGKLPIPMSCKDIPQLENHASYCIYQGRQMLGMRTLLSDHVSQWIFDIPYPITIQK